MNSLLSDYLCGFKGLKENLQKNGSDYEIVSMLQIRLKENIEKVRIQGDIRETSAERMAILSIANEITERICGMSFDDFCQSSRCKDRSSETENHLRSSEITSVEHEELQASLLSAFSTPGDLQQMVAFKLGENLSVIAGGNNYGEVVFNLIVWMEAHGKTENLIAGARQMNPGNPKLRAFEEKYRQRRKKV